MRLARIAVNGVATYGLVHTDGKLYDLPKLLTLSAAIRGKKVDPPKTMLDAAMGGPLLLAAVNNALAEVKANGLIDQVTFPSDSRQLAPLTRPNRILAIGRNYAEHAKEQGASVTEEPIVFLKASTSVIGPDAPIRIPENIGRVDYEAELLVILGKGGKNVPESEAMSLVAGYTIFNDVTARDVQKKDQANKHPWFRSKSIDTFGPMGPVIVTPEEVPDPHDLRISLTVNGETKQDDTTGSMVFRIPFLIAYLSQWFALEPGDVIATGTPSGIGPIIPGDSVAVTITGLGTLTNPVVAE